MERLPLDYSSKWHHHLTFKGLGRSPQTEPYQATLLALYGLSLRGVVAVLALLELS